MDALIDLVKEESERIDARFLEPVCGSGNFFVKVLQRKPPTGHTPHYQKPKLLAEAPNQV